MNSIEEKPNRGWWRHCKRGRITLSKRRLSQMGPFYSFGKDKKSPPMLCGCSKLAVINMVKIHYCDIR